MRLQIEKGRWLHTATVPHQIFENVLLFLYFVLFERLGMYLFTKIETKRLFKGRIVQILGLFDIVSSDLCLILSNLRAAASFFSFIFIPSSIMQLKQYRWGCLSFLRRDFSLPTIANYSSRPHSFALRFSNHLISM